MNATFEVDNDLQIKNFSIVYQNNTERVFKIALNNTLNSTLNNVSWYINNGENLESSQYDLSLEGGEEIYVFLYHNYSTSGSYNLTASVSSDTFIDTKNFTINI
jgi:outer membrane lipoprotein-sorting protein